VAYNYWDSNSNWQQYGGNVIFSISNAAHQVLKSGRDETGLGHLTWMRFQGRNGIVTQAVCAYQPCKPLGDNKVHSIYAQHQWYFDEKQDDICP
jgi:hypothetical protein